MAGTGSLDFAVEDGIGLVTFDNPSSRNAMTWSMLERLAQVWDEVDADPAVEVVILTGAERDFCSGGDLKTLATDALALSDGGGAPLDEMFSVAFRAFQRGVRVKTPTICAVEGVAIGGGLEIVLATDIRIVAADARLALPEARRGLFPAAGGVVRALQQLPYPVAAQLLLTGEEFTASRALEIGLVGEVVAPGNALVRAREIARSITSNSPATVRGITRVLRTMTAEREAAPLDHELAAAMAALAEGDAHTGVAAFADKREATYR